MKDPSLIEHAVSLFNDSYLCSQSILMAYAQRFGINQAEAARIAAPFGAGMSRMGMTCGAVSGALMVIGLFYGHEIGNDVETKEHMYEKVSMFISQFETRNGSVVCRELIGHDLSTSEGLNSARASGLFETKCPNLVRDAAEIVGSLIQVDS